MRRAGGAVLDEEEIRITIKIKTKSRSMAWFIEL